MQNFKFALSAVGEKSQWVFLMSEWVDWFNYRRLLQQVGYTPPAEAKDRYYATMEPTAMAA